ncbi:MAG: ATP-binding protein [Desulfobacterales bacterium]|nr:ATP-binding protein [Desulfobacterales bacterium]
MEFYILAGLPGSGKSTTGQRLKQEKNCFVVSSDTIRLALNAGIYPRDDEKGDYTFLEPIVWDLVSKAIHFLLQKGRSVALDATNLNRQSRKQWIDLAYSINPNIEITVLWHTSNYDSPQRWQQERGHIEKEYWRIRSKLESNIELPSEDEGIKVQIIDQFSEKE